MRFVFLFVFHRVAGEKAEGEGGGGGGSRNAETLPLQKSRREKKNARMERFFGRPIELASDNSPGRKKIAPKKKEDSVLYTTATFNKYTIECEIPWQQIDCT